jgi:hypothetical protein
MFQTTNQFLLHVTILNPPATKKGKRTKNMYDLCGEWNLWHNSKQGDHSVWARSGMTRNTMRSEVEKRGYDSYHPNINLSLAFGCSAKQ